MKLLRNPNTKGTDCKKEFYSFSSVHNPLTAAAVSLSPHSCSSVSHPSQLQQCLSPLTAAAVSIIPSQLQQCLSPPNSCSSVSHPSQLQQHLSPPHSCSSVYTLLPPWNSPASLQPSKEQWEDMDHPQPLFLVLFPLQDLRCVAQPLPPSANPTGMHHYNQHHCRILRTVKHISTLVVHAFNTNIWKAEAS